MVQSLRGGASSSQGTWIHREAECPIRRRRSDGYLDATAMCQANGKLWGNFYQLDGTQRFLQGLSSDIGIPISGPAGLVQSLRSGPSRGTWVHRIIGLKLAAWLSAEFEVRVYQWYADTAGQR